MTATVARMVCRSRPHIYNVAHGHNVVAFAYTSVVSQYNPGVAVRDSDTRVGTSVMASMTSEPAKQRLPNTQTDDDGDDERDLESPKTAR